MSPPRAQLVPEALLALAAEVAAERFGPAALAGPALADAVRRLSTLYTRERAGIPALAGDEAALCARLTFFLPRDLPKGVAPLRELSRVGALPSGRPLRVLDLGAGLGACTLAALQVLAEAEPGAALQVDAVDVDERALELLGTLCERRGRQLGVTLDLRTHARSLTARLPPTLSGPYDLILLGFVLNELAEGEPDPGRHHAEVLSTLAGRLSPDGALLALEPALREHSRALQAARGHLIAAGGPPHVFAPCLHHRPCPLLERERDWCHERLRAPLPEPVAALARAAGLREADLSYSYLTLCAAPRSLAELPHASGELVRVVTAPLPSKGKLELGVCGGGAAHKLRLLDRHARVHGELLRGVGRGSVLAVHGAELRGDALSIGEHTEISTP